MLFVFAELPSGSTVVLSLLVVLRPLEHQALTFIVVQMPGGSVGTLAQGGMLLSYED